MFRIAVCDDDRVELVVVTAFIREYRKIRTDVDITFEIFSSAEHLCSRLDNGERFDLYLLDILMPDMDGLVLGQRIRDYDRRGAIVYLTATAEYALRAFNVYALQYLIKPVTRDLFFETLQKAIEIVSPTTERGHMIHTIHGDIRKSPIEILYIQLNGHTLQYHLVDGTVLQSKNIRVPFAEAIAPLTGQYHFRIIHQSYAVNTNHIERHSGSELFLEGLSEPLPVSKCHMKELKEFMKQR